MSSQKKIIVVGAGFSGLSVSYWALKQGFDVELYEAASQAGGLLKSQKLLEEHLVESAANGFLFQPEFEVLEQDLGIRFAPTLESSRRRYFFRNKIRRWPLNIWESCVSFLKMVWNFSSWSPQKKETLRTWAERVFGKAASRYLIETALQGIYAGRAQEMSASLIMGRFFSKQKLPKKQRPQFSGPARWGTHTHPQGMGALIANWLEFLKKDSRFNYKPQHETCLEDFKSDLAQGARLFVCVPPPKAVQFFKSSYPKLSEQLSTIEMLPVLSSTLVFSKSASPQTCGETGMPQGFGILFSREQGFDVMGVLRNHCIFGQRSSQVSETWIYSGRDLKNKQIWNNEEACLDLILSERHKLSGIKLTPLAYKMHFWEEALPHYDLKLEEFLSSQALKELPDQIQLFGNYTGQIGLARIYLAAKEKMENLTQ